MRSPVVRTILAVAILACLAVVAIPHLPLSSASAASDEDYRRMRLFTEVMREIQQKYVEEKTASDLITSAIKGMVADLDPHSSYLTPEEFKELQEETKGSFSGVGIEITMKDGILTVVSPIEGTPAYKAGVKAGDRIIKIDGKVTKGMSLMDAVKAIRGAKGTAVVLTLLSEGAGKLRDVSITRDMIPLKSVRFNLLENGYGYVRISSFQEDTAEDLAEALNELQSQKPPLKGLVIDLRNNPGGLLQEAVNVSDLFLDNGVIVSTRGRLPSQEMVFRATPQVTAGNYPVIVLVNQGSASASEIVAGALQDHKRAMVVGMPTFGKGSVQTILPLQDNGALRLTTARYYTPAGTAIQAKGIKPDLEVAFVPPPEEPEEKAKTSQAIREKDLQGAMAPEETAEPKDAAAKDNGKNKLMIPKDRLDRDNQLKQSLDLLKAWQVFSHLADEKKAPAAAR